MRCLCCLRHTLLNSVAHIMPINIMCNAVQTYCEINGVSISYHICVWPDIKEALLLKWRTGFCLSHHHYYHPSVRNKYNKCTREECVVSMAMVLSTKINAINRSTDCNLWCPSYRLTLLYSALLYKIDPTFSTVNV